jgi:hypothetical protein
MNFFTSGQEDRALVGDSSQGWRRSSLSWGNGNCVEVGGLSRDLIGIRDSKSPKGAVLGFTVAQWDAFLADVRNGKFDGHL